jgi:hypothetical protein
MPMLTAERAHEVAAVGADWMDERCPGWAQRINLDDLNLGDPYLCILGQTVDCLVPAEKRSYRNSGFGDVLDYYVGDRLSANDWANERGFDTRTMQYEMLQIAWVEQIRRRSEPQEYVS